MPVFRPPKIGRILKTLDIAEPKFLKEFHGVVEKKPYLTEFIDRIDASLEYKSVQSNLKQSLHGVFTGDDNTIKEIYKVSENVKKRSDYAFKLSTKGLKDSEHFRNTKVSLRQDLRALEHTAVQQYKLYEQNIVGKLKEGGLETFETFNLIKNEPNKFKQLYNMDQDAIFEHLIDGTSSGVKSVDNIVNALKTSDKEIIKGLQDQGTFIGHANDHALPFNVSPEAVELLGKDNVFNLIIKHTNIDEKKAKGLVGALGSWQKYRTANLDQGIFGVGNVKFNSGKDAIEFFKAVNDKDFGVSLINDYLGYKQRLIKKSALINQFGSDPVATLEQAIRKARQSSTVIDKELTKGYEALADDLNLRLQVYSGKSFMDNKFLGSLSTAFNQSLSLVTAAPARSAVRNLFIDFEGHAQAIGSSLYNGNFRLGGSAARIVKNLSYLIGQVAGGKGNKIKKQAVKDILDIAGFGNSIDGLAHNNLLGFEDVFDANIGKGLGSKDYKQFLVNKLNEKLSGANSFLHKVSGNHALLDFVRVRRFMSLQQMFSKVIEYESFGGWLKSLTSIERAQANTLFKQIGFDKNMFDFLKVSSKTSLNIDKKLSKSLGFDRQSPFLTRESILETADDVADKFKRKGETSKQYKEKIARNWQNFIYHVTQQAAPVPTIADSVTVPLLSNTPAYMSLILRSFLKFGDVAQAQFNELAERVGTSVYGSPHKYIGMDKSLLAWGKLSAKYTTYAAATIWLKDILNNRTPTDFKKPDNAVKLVMTSGLGGFYAMIGSNVMGTFGDTGGGILSGTPAVALGRGVDKISGSITGVKPLQLGAGLLTGNEKKVNRALTAEKGFGRALHAIHDINPYTRLWYASGVVEYIMNNIMLSEPERRQQYENLERYGKPYLF